MSKKKKQALFILLELILICVIGLGAGYYYLTTKRRPIMATKRNLQTASSVSANPVGYENFIAVDENLDADVTYTNIALVGLDVRDQNNLDFANSDTMIIASINNVTGDVRMVSVYRDTLVNVDTKEGDPVIDSLKEGIDNGYSASTIGRYDKANSAYMYGGIDRMIAMMENNFDIHIDGYAVVNFSAVSEVVEDLGGIDVWMTKQEVIHMNNYCVETSAATGRSYTPITPDEEAHDYHLNGVQAVSYARIRYTAGNDMKRTQRQRVVINKIVDKAKSQPLAAIKTIITNVLPNCKTSLPLDDLFSYAANIQYYQIEKTSGFPFTHIERHCWPNGKEIDPVVPVTLAENVKMLHEFLFNETEYEPTLLTSYFSRGIEEISGLTANDIPAAEQNSVIANNGGEADVVK